MSSSRVVFRCATRTLTGLVAAHALATAAAATSTAGPHRLAVPLAFEKNLGQSAPEVDFLARGPGYTLFLAGGNAVFAFRPRTGQSDPCALTMRFAGARPAAPAVGEQRLASKSHYIRLDGSPRGSGEVDRFGRVRYAALLDGVDLLFYGREGALEYDLELAAGKSATPPVLELEGASDLAIGAAGELRIGVCGTEVVFQPPVAFQQAGDGRQLVKADYRLLAGSRATFALGDHDPRLPLVIDPVFSYATCLGGANADHANDLAVTSTGEVYVVGTTTSADFPTRDPIRGYGGGLEVFISKLNASGTDLVYSTYAGANADDQEGNGIAVNAAGEAFVAGTSCIAGGSCQAFLLKLTAAGGFGFSSVFGGANDERGEEVALDSSGNAVVVGMTSSSDFPVLNPIQATGNGLDAFLRRYSSTGTLLSSSYVGGAGSQYASAVALGPNNAIYLGGLAYSGSFSEIWVAKVNAAATSVVYNRTVGGSTSESADDIAVDAGSRAYLVGRTDSTDFPTVLPIDPTNPNGDSGFLTILDSTGATSVATYLNDLSWAQGVAVGPGGEVWVTGRASGTSPWGGVYLVKINNTFSTRLLSTRIGDSGGFDEGRAIRVDAGGGVYIAGTGSSSATTTVGAFQGCSAGLDNAYVAKILEANATLALSDPTVAEQGPGAWPVAGFSVSLSAPPVRTVTFSYATANGTATQPADYLSKSGTDGSIPAGATSAVVDVFVVGDAIDEPNETFLLNVSSVVGATVADGAGQATILDDDPNPALSVSDCTVTEGNAGTVNCTFTVSLSAASGQTVTVSRATANGTAVAPGDYTALAAATLTFNPGETSKAVNVAVVGDTLDEPTETFSLTLSSPANATIADGTGTGTITDNDAAPTLAVSNCTVTEGNAGTVNCAFTVSLSAASGQTVTVSRATANGTAVAPGDYTALAAATLTFNPGETSKGVNVAVVGDLASEPDETFSLSLSAPVNATLADATGLGTILNEDSGLPFADSFESGDFSSWDAGRGALDAPGRPDGGELGARETARWPAATVPEWVAEGIGEVVYVPTDLFGEAPSIPEARSVALLSSTNGAELLRLTLARGNALTALRVRLSLAGDSWCRSATAWTDAVPEPVVTVRRSPTGAWEVTYGRAFVVLDGACSPGAD